MKYTKLPHISAQSCGFLDTERSLYSREDTYHLFFAVLALPEVPLGARMVLSATLANIDLRIRFPIFLIALCLSPINESLLQARTPCLILGTIATVPRFCDCVNYNIKSFAPISILTSIPHQIEKIISSFKSFSCISRI